MIEGQEAIGSTARLTYGLIGGGKGAFIGDVHRKAIGMDGKARLVAGCFSQSYENTLTTGEAWGVDKSRLYKTFEEMFRTEAGRNDKIDFVVVAAPQQHPFSSRQTGRRERDPRRLRQATNDDSS